jgi:hypothetical protein
MLKLLIFLNKDLEFKKKKDACTWQGITEPTLEGQLLPAL